MAAGLLVISAVADTSGDDDGDRQVDASETTVTADRLPSVEDATDAALDDLAVEVSRARMLSLVQQLCDGSEVGAARALVAITPDADDQVAVLEAAGSAAEDACPETTSAEPQLLNAVYAAVGTTTTTTTQPAVVTTVPPTSPTTVAPATTRAPSPTQPRTTQPPATQPPATQPAAQQCHPSYSGACLDPGSADYDCAGGSGNGPDYTGPVQVVGPDPFGLDADGDGYGCED